MQCSSTNRVNGVLNKLSRRVISDGRTLAIYIGEIFAQIANIEQPASEADRVGIQKVYKKLSPPKFTDESIATYTGELFFEIVALTENDKAKELIRASNERLYYLRKLECQYFKNAASELVVLCELALAWCRDELKQAINAYHDRRRELPPN